MLTVGRNLLRRERERSPSLERGRCRGGTPPQSTTTSLTPHIVCNRALCQALPGEGEVQGGHSATLHHHLPHTTHSLQ